MPIANITGTGNTWNLPNYAGELFTASPTKTPLLSMAGGLTGGMRTENDKFPTDVLYAFPDAAQPAITETASETAPAATELAREQEYNVTQIFHEAITLTYAKMANRGKLSGLNTAGAAANPPSELDWQIARRLEKVARDVEFTFLNGTYAEATSATVANKTRGLFALCGGTGGTTIANAEPAALTLNMLKTLYKAMADAGAAFGNMVCFVNSFQKQVLTALYESQLGYNTGAPRNVGGMSITEIENDFFKMGIVYDPFVPAGSLLIADVANIAPVFQDVPGKGVLFIEDLAKTGAADKKQLYGEIGLAHGPAFLHASITGLAAA
jgi:hypothetical protein